MTVNLTTLSNGFRIVTEHMPGLQSASIGIWVLAGARHEEAAQNGIAHFLEHMAFKGTERRSALQIAEAIEDVGGYINAYTSREVTAYYARVLQDDVPLALDVIADILRNPVFDPNEIEIERGVILQEIGQALDTPDDIIFDWLQEKAYPDHPLGRTILGPEDRVRAFSRADLQGFVGQHYKPGQMILAAAGAVDHAALVQAAEALFGDMAAAPIIQAPSAKFAGGESRHIKPLEQAHFALAFESPNYMDPGDLYGADLCQRAWGQHVISAVPGGARKARALLHDLCAGRSLCGYRHDDDLRGHIGRANDRSGADHCG